MMKAYSTYHQDVCPDSRRGPRSLPLTQNRSATILHSISFRYLDSLATQIKVTHSASRHPRLPISLKVPLCHAPPIQVRPFVDPKQPPQKKKPFDTLLALKWCHTVDLILPAEIVEVVQREIEDQKRSEVRYAKVVMSLSEIVEGDFFDQYVKKGMPHGEGLAESNRELMD